MFIILIIMLIIVRIIMPPISVFLCLSLQVLGLIWQIIKIQLTSQISLKNFPELVLLLEEGEELSKFMKLPPEEILLRWVNYHLKKAGADRRISNFGVDVKVVLDRIMMMRKYMMMIKMKMKTISMTMMMDKIMDERDDNHYDDGYNDDG